jgi:hypothetical protein
MRTEKEIEEELKLAESYYRNFARDSRFAHSNRYTGYINGLKFAMGYLLSSQVIDDFNDRFKPDEIDIILKKIKKED